MRNRLRDVVNSPLSDAEKHQLIQDSQRLHSSAPASIALPTVSDYYVNDLQILFLTNFNMVTFICIFRLRIVMKLYLLAE